MTLEEAKEICAKGWPENQRMQQRFDVEQWLISEVERLQQLVTDPCDGCSTAPIDCPGWVKGLSDHEQPCRQPK